MLVGQIVEEAERISEQIKNKEVNEKFVQQPTLRGIECRSKTAIYIMMS